MYLTFERAFEKIKIFKRSDNNYQYGISADVTVTVGDSNCQKITTTDEYFEMPEAGICYFSGDDYSLFESRVFELLEMPQLEYKKLVTERARHICNFNPNFMPQDIIRSKVLNAIHQTEMK